MNQLPISAGDVAYAALLAFFLTWTITTISRAFKMLVSHSSEFDYNPKDIPKLMQRCYALFPKEFVLFKGKTFKRGMTVRVTTVSQKIFEGQFVGTNNDNLLCVVTNKNIVAQEIEDIQEMVMLE